MKKIFLQWNFIKKMEQVHAINAFVMVIGPGEKIPNFSRCVFLGNSNMI